MVKPRVYARDYGFGAPLAGAEQGLVPATDINRHPQHTVNDRDLTHR
jgi:hypothetical protein